MPKEKAQANTQLFCHCRKPARGFMICCDGCCNWYHGRCVAMNSTSSKKFKKWFCRACSSPTVQTSLSNSIEELRQEIIQAKSELRAEFHLDKDRLEKEVKKVQVENLTLTAALKKKESENQNLQNDLQQEKGAHQSCCEENDSLKQQINTVLEENLQLTRAFNQIKNKYRNLHNDFEQKSAQGLCQDEDKLKSVLDKNAWLMDTLKFKERDFHNLIITMCQKSLDEVHQTSAQRELELEIKNLRDKVNSLNKRSRLSLKSSQK